MKSLHEAITQRYGDTELVHDTDICLVSSSYLALLLAGNFPGRSLAQVQSLLGNLRDRLVKCAHSMPRSDGYMDWDDQQVQDDYESEACRIRRAGEKG